MDTIEKTATGVGEDGAVGALVTGVGEDGAVSALYVPAHLGNSLAACNAYTITMQPSNALLGVCSRAMKIHVHGRHRGSLG